MEIKNIDNKFIRKVFIAFLAVIGILTTIKLAVIYYNSNFNPYALPSFCSVSEFVDCDGVAKDPHSQFWGIPLAYWGLGLYLFMLLMLFVDKLKEFRFLKFLEVFQHPFAYISSLGYVSFLISMILAGISVRGIGKICVLCVFTYVLNLLIAIIATDWVPHKAESLSSQKDECEQQEEAESAKKECSYSMFCVGITNGFVLSIRDFYEAIKIKKYFITFSVLVLAAAAFLTYTGTTYVFAPQVKRAKSFKEFTDLKQNPYSVVGNVLGDKDADVKVHVYSDYMCPICKTSNIMDHKVAQELKNVKIIHHDLPLDMECNKYLKAKFHEGSCLTARYSIAAKKQGHLWDMHNLLFEHTPTTEDEILFLASTLGLDVDKLKADANSQAVKEKVQSEIEESAELGINGTPTMVINGKLYMGIMPFYEYKEILKKAGASERR